MYDFAVYACLLEETLRMKQNLYGMIESARIFASKVNNEDRVAARQSDLFSTHASTELRCYSGFAPGRRLNLCDVGTQTDIVHH